MKKLLAFFTVIGIVGVGIFIFISHKAEQSSSAIQPTQVADEVQRKATTTLPIQVQKNNIPSPAKTVVKPSEIASSSQRQPDLQKQSATSTVSGKTTLTGFPLCMSRQVANLLKKEQIDGADHICEIPPSIVAAGDAYIKGLLGETYFSKYITLETDTATLLKDATGKEFWEVKYHDNRFAQMFGENPLSIDLTISVSDLYVESDEMIPSCVETPVLCETNVSRKQASDIAHANNLDSDTTKQFLMYVSYEKMSDAGFVWVLKQTDKAKKACPDPSSISKTITINVGTGKVSPIIETPGGGDCLRWSSE